MKFAILFALVASACASSHFAAPAIAASSPGFISGRSFSTGSNFIYPGSNFVYPGSNFVQTPTTYSAVAPGNFVYPGSNFVYPGSNFVYPGSSFVPTTYSAVKPGSFAFRSAVIPSAVSYQSAPTAAITYSAPVAAYSAPAVATYSAPAVATYSAIAPIVAPKTIAQTKGSSHITY